MKMCMNFKFVVLFALTLLAGSTVYGQDNVIDEVVWVVGDEAILKSEVEEARMSALYEGRKFDRDPYCVPYKSCSCIRRHLTVLKFPNPKSSSVWII